MSEIALAIHGSRSGFSRHWIDYCRRKEVPYKVVNCYDNDIVEQIRDCSALLWHYSHSDPKDVIIARQILFALEHGGFEVFPDFRMAWHFDDKVGQKYLFEALDIPRMGSYVFVDRAVALEWAEKTDYPKVFKLRHGASSSCVRLVRSKREARRIIKRAFWHGFPVYSPWVNLKKRFQRAGQSKADAIELAKGIARFFYTPRFSHVLGQQNGYVLFQDFAPGNDSDIRIVVVGDKAFGARRWVRQGDFRASGSQRLSYEPEHIDIEYVALAFNLANKLGCGCLAFDFVRKRDHSVAVIEVSYGFGWKGNSPGYWDSGLQWHAENYRPEEWMVDLVLKNVSKASMTAGPKGNLELPRPASGGRPGRGHSSDD